jgi:cyclopropane-fatty-acyl-phospholipid synthase
MVEGASRRLALKGLSRLRDGQLELIEPDGKRLRFGDPRGELAATVEIHSPRFYRAMLGGSVGLGEAYRNGVWDCDDLVALIRIAVRNMGSLDRWRQRIHPLLALPQRTLGRVPRNSRRAARRHISAHYDLGNNLFALFLDESMMYSSAVFPHPDASLGEAQVHRLDRVCRSLELGPGDHLLEIGTGWGAG